MNVPPPRKRRRHFSRTGVLALVLLAVPCSAIALEPQPGSISFHSPWIWTDFGQILPSPRFSLLDVNGDGKSEIFSDSSREYDHGDEFRSNWFVLRGDPNLRQVWASLPNADYRRAPKVASTVTGDSLITIGGSTFEIIEPSTFEVVRTIPTETSTVFEYLAAELASAGSARVVSCGSDALRVHDFQSGNVLASIPISACDGLAVGNADSDPALEILVTRSTSGVWLLDGSTFEVEWSDPSTPAWSPLFAQVSADPSLEPIVASVGEVRALEGETGLALWQRSDLPAWAVAAGEAIPSHPGVEVVVAGPPGLPLQVLDAASGATISTSAKWQYETHQLALADVSGDSQLEIIVATGDDTPNGEVFLVVSPVTGKVLDSVHRFRGPFTGLAVADTNTDGTREIVMSPFVAGSSAVVDVDDRSIRYQTVPYEDWTTRILGTLGQIDEDPPLEYCFVVCPSCGGVRLRCEELPSFTSEWEVLLPRDTDVRAIELLDLDGDDTLELVAATHDFGIYAFEGATGWLRWRTPAVAGANFRALDVADLDSDLELELVAGGFPLTVFRAADGSLEYGPLAGLTVAYGVFDIGGMGLPIVVAGLSDGSIHVVDPVTGGVGAQLAQLPYLPRSLRIGDLDRDGALELAMVTPNQTLSVWRIGAPAQAWESAPLGYIVATWDDFEIVDTDRDTIPELLVDTGFGFALFEGPEYLLLAAGFETGDTSEWSTSQP